MSYTPAWSRVRERWGLASASGMSETAARASARARSTRSGSRPRLEGLESRLVPAVNAVLSGTTLNVTLSGMKDQAVLSEITANACIEVSGFDANGKETFD